MHASCAQLLRLMYKPKINEGDTHANGLSLPIMHIVEYILTQSFIHALTTTILSQWQLRGNMYGTLTGDPKFFPHYKPILYCIYKYILLIVFSTKCH